MDLGDGGLVAHGAGRDGADVGPLDGLEFLVARFLDGRAAGGGDGRLVHRDRLAREPAVRFQVEFLRDFGVHAE